jgi:hypothetical protein
MVIARATRRGAVFTATTGVKRKILKTAIGMLSAFGVEGVPPSAAAERQSGGRMQQLQSPPFSSSSFLFVFREQG